MNEHYYSVLKLMDDRNKENISVTHSSFAELGLDEDTLDEILISLFEKGLYEKAIISKHPNFKGIKLMSPRLTETGIKYLQIF